MASIALRLPGLGTLRNLALLGALPAALLVFWHLASVNGWIQAYLLPSPAAALEGFKVSTGVQT